MSMKKCHLCGKDLPDYARKCKYCDAKLESPNLISLPNKPFTEEFLNADEKPPAKENPEIELIRSLDINISVSGLKRAIESLKTLAIQGEVQAVETLIAALKHYSPPVAAEAAQALGGVRAIQAVEPLLEALQRYDDNPSGLWSMLSDPFNYSSYKVAGEAAVALGKIGDIRALNPLINLLSSKAMPLNVAAYEALEWFGDKAVRPLIKTLLYSEDEKVRSSSAYILGRLKASLSVSTLIKALKDSSWRVRREAVQALGRFNDPQLVEFIIPILEDKNEFVRSEAMKVLQRINTPEAKHILRKYGKQWWQFWK